jgi:serine protease Do
MNCVCGHPERDHVRGGRCRVPDCPCERFRPGDTLGVRAAGRGCRAIGALAALLGVLVLAPAPSGAAPRSAPPASFAPVAGAARAASIVIRATEDADDLASAPVNEDDDPGMPADPDAPLDRPSGAETRTLAVGVIVSPRGFALTSARAILGRPGFEVFLLDGTAVPSTLLALDLRSDVALLELKAGPGPWPHLPLADADGVEAGEWVIAVGAPMGLEGTVTAGVVTALPVPGAQGTLAAFLQTDAAMSRGNAGGPIVSLRGEVVGLASGFRADGVGYARPAGLVHKVYLELVERGHVRRPWLGVATQTLGAQLARALGAPGATGVLVADVIPDGPGGAAGLRSGDIIVAVEATAVASRAQLERVVGALTPGRVVRVQVRRAAATLAVRVTLGDEPDEWRLPPLLVRTREQLGLEVRALTPTMGVVAADVEPGSPAAVAGLEPGDLVREVDRRPIRTIADFQAAVRSLPARRPVAVLVQRGEAAVYVVLDPRP